MENITSTGKLWQWSDGKEKASWFFLTIEKEVGEKIKALMSLEPRKGWGSVRVRARIGYVSRETSIFPDSKTGAYLLPLKKEVRKELNMKEGDVLSVGLELL